MPRPVLHLRRTTISSRRTPEGWHGYNRKKYIAMLREAFEPFELFIRKPEAISPKILRTEFELLLLFAGQSALQLQCVPRFDSFHEQTD